MLDRPRHLDARLVEQDIRDFRCRHQGLIPQATSNIRNAFHCCQGYTAGLEAMYQHYINCPTCIRRVGPIKAQTPW